MRSAAAQYLQEVNKQITCPNSLKKPFLRQLKTEALCFCAEHDGADIHMLSGQFGTPEEVAGEFLAELSSRTVAHYSSKRKQILRFTIAVVLTAVIAFTFLGIQKYYLRQKLTEEEFVASITYEKESDSNQSWFLSQDTIFGSTGSVKKD